MIKEITAKQRLSFDQLAAHPLQSFAWGEFREKTGVEVTRIGKYVNSRLAETAQVTWHKIPKLPWKIGYWPKGYIPSTDMLLAIKEEAKKHGAIMVKLEPNEIKTVKTEAKLNKLEKAFNLVRGRALFTKWSFWWDIAKPEEQLLLGMKQKTRYNTRLAEKKGVKVEINDSEEAFEEYWKLTEETTKRQGFYAHTKNYHETMFRSLSKVGLATLFRARYQGKTLATWIIFKLNKIIYYPYGASTRDDANVFASNLLMWEVAKWGKKEGCTLFDLWGSPGPNPKPSDNWYGFHHFKEGYGAQLVEFVGSFDLIINPMLYWPYRFGEKIRWLVLRTFSKIK